MSEKSLQTGTILVLGASGGVGQCLTRQLLDAGYTVLGSALDDTDLEAMRSKDFGAADLFVADFSSADVGISQLKDALRRSDRPLTAVISCVGVNPSGPLETTPIEMFRRTVEINTVSNLAVYQATLGQIRESKGRFIFVGSMSGKVAFPLLGYYTASKYALEGLADTMRLEAGQWGIPVSLIQPGAIATGMVHGFAAQLDRGFDQLDDQGKRNYGHYYAQQKAFSQNAHALAIAPDAVAETIIQALEADVPAARYPVGNAVDLLERRRVSTDMEIDTLFNQLLPGSRVMSQSTDPA
ncbi:SDR family NAD(P)-dependent oxidoreductase [Sphingobium sp. CR2-8]|uniref:SDR family NAD(P)-dependent oxidoreductase n=1 Tax=Sphingobium sp. CR2-8 TaxID=1306534 RepID=UPI002DB86B06|nr:SDR family NAD(P)-dependent oxidoreductase [Sphingobium sp. CR2-8]MEC3909128.1 SDR family NAD(P)-dependent oxidoreductase [Sphingobium sp. CR2-8]